MYGPMAPAMVLPAPMMSAAAPPAEVRSLESRPSASSRAWASSGLGLGFRSSSLSLAMRAPASAWALSMAELRALPAEPIVSAAPVTMSQSLTRWKLALTQARPEAGSVKAY